MSVYVTAWLYHEGPEDLRPAEMLVALVLADHADSENAYAYPSVNRIVKMSRLSRSTVRSAIDSLEKKGIIKTIRPATNNKPAWWQFPAYKGGSIPGPRTESSGTDPQPLRADSQPSGGPGAGPEPSSNRQGTANTSSSPSEGPLHKEMSHPFWTAPRRAVFDRFWTLYKKVAETRAVDRAGSMRAWRNVIAELTDDREWLQNQFGKGLDQNLRAWAEWPDEEKQYIPHTKTWLNQQRWNTPVGER